MGQFWMGTREQEPPFLGDSLLCGIVILRLKAGRGHSDYVPMAIMFFLGLNSLKSFQPHYETLICNGLICDVILSFLVVKQCWN